MLFVFGDNGDNGDNGADMDHEDAVKNILAKDQDLMRNPNMLMEYCCIILMKKTVNK